MSALDLVRIPMALLLVALLSAAALANSGDGGGQPEKASRTPAQRKINSQVLYEIYRARGQAGQKNVPPSTAVRVDEHRRALVDVRAEVTPALRQKIEAVGGTVVSVSEKARSTIAWVPLLKIEEVAALDSVRSIEPAAEATTVR